MMVTMLLQGLVQDHTMAEATCEEPSEETGKPNVRKPWRSGRYTIYLWEFLCSLLQDQDCSSLIAWTNKDKKEFKMFNTSEIAKLWGSIKNRPTMDDKKLLRALRYYYKTKILKKVKGQKGVYQFLAIPYETKECEQGTEAGISHVPTQFETGESNDKHRERTESSSSSSQSSEGTMSNEEYLDKNLMNDIDQMMMDSEFVFDDGPGKYRSDYAVKRS